MSGTNSFHSRSSSKLSSVSFSGVSLSLSDGGSLQC